MAGKRLIDDLDAYIRSAEMAKQAEGSAQAGHVQDQGDSNTTHPSSSVDAGIQPATQGARSSENTADVKKQNPLSVDAAGEDKADGKSKDEATNATFTGEDPSSETESVGDRPEPQGDETVDGKKTDHPANTSFGDKYASLINGAASLVALANTQNAKVAALNISVTAPAKPGAAEPAKPAAKSAGADPAKPATNPDEEAGRKAAEAVDQNLPQEPDPDTAAQLITFAKAAFDDANRLADLYDGMRQGGKLVDGYAAGVRGASQLRQKSARAAAALHKRASLSVHQALLQIQKAAMDEAAMGADAMTAGSPEEPLPDEAGGMPEGMPGGEAGGAISPEEIEQVLALLQQANIPPEEIANADPQMLAQVIAEAISGGAGGAGGAGGMPEGADPTGGAAGGAGAGGPPPTEDPAAAMAAA